MTIRETTPPRIGKTGLVLAGLAAFSCAPALNFTDPKGPLWESRNPGGAAGTPVITGNSFSVVSFNIHFGYDPGAAAETMAENGMEKADIVLLQEADDNSVRVFSKALSMGYVYYPAAVHPSSKKLFGVAVLSRWPIVASRKILLPKKSLTDGARKVALAAIIEIDRVPIEVVNIHMESGLLGPAFRSQARIALACAFDDRCEGDPPAPVSAGRARVVGGDFNTWYESRKWKAGLETDLIEIMEAVALKRVPGIESTFPRKHFPKNVTLDYFFVSEDLYMAPGRVGTSLTGSDHYPIEVKLRLPR